MRRQVDAEERTGRVEGQVRHVSKASPQVSQSGWQARQVVELEGGAKWPVGQVGPLMQVPLSTSLEASLQVVQSAEVVPEQVEQLESQAASSRGVSENSVRASLARELTNAAQAILCRRGSRRARVYAGSVNEEPSRDASRAGELRPS